MKNLLFAVFCLFITQEVYSQNEYTLKGKVCDASNQNWLEGVSVGVRELPQTGCLTDDIGNYTLTLPKGEYTFVFSLLGYIVQEVQLSIQSNKKLDIDLKPDAVSLTEVVVSAHRRDENIKSTQLGKDRLEIATVNKIPVLLGEKDILKTIQLLPGVQSAGEGNTGFYVRGGSSDQNLILLDNATVYNPSHLFGFFSTFNSDAVEDMTIYKGTMPAQYGGRLSSTLDVSMRDGDMKKYSVSGGVGLISSKINFEGPIQKEKSSFIVSARRTYADVLARGMGVEGVKNSTMYFYDLNAKLSYVLSDKDKLTLTAYHGKDDLGINKIASFDWSNTIGSLKWNHKFSDTRSSVTTLSYTDYTYNVGVELTTGLKLASHIRDYNFSQEFRFYPNDKNAIKVGFRSTYHQVVPGELKSKDESRLKVTPYEHRYSWENAIYASNDMKLSDKLNVNYGLRLTSFSVLGGGYFYTYDNNHEVVDSINTKRGNFVKTYWSVEPRLSAAYHLNDVSSLKAAYTRATQNMHLLSTSNMANPTDRWIANTNYIKPEISNQFSLGYFRNFNNNEYEFSAEVYYKNLQNQVDFKDGAETYNKDNVETELLFGKGRAYGLELFLKKRTGRFNGWVGYTLSRSERLIDGINDNKWYVSNQDRTHDISVVGIYELDKKWTLSAAWVYSTGSPMTFPAGKYSIDKHTVYYYEGRNKYRAADFHRLDLGATCVLKKTKKFYSELAFSLYNAYGRQNAYMYTFEQNYSQDYESQVKMIYLFSIIPSVSWNFKF